MEVQLKAGQGFGGPVCWAERNQTLEDSLRAQRGWLVRLVSGFRLMFLSAFQTLSRQLFGFRLAWNTDRTTTRSSSSTKKTS